ncbi:hypothetical protein NDA01_27745 [Trichocoleus desertorum AS-A10]|uniref:hypothetical protein n=1 Tax=Trichocoleus desertorum TaxID=1481672 RepID=UPI00329904E9
MSKYLKWAIFLFILVLIYFFYPKERFSKYESLIYGIEVSYPKDWSIEEISQSEPEKVLRFSSSKGELVINIENLSPPLKLNEYTRLIIRQRTKFPNNIKIETERTNLAGHSAFRANYDFYDNNKKTNIWSSQIWSVKDNFAYMLTYRQYFNIGLSFDKDEYRRFLNRSSKITKSFNIT